MKKIGIVLLVIVVALIGIAIFATSKLDGIIAEAIRTEGTASVGQQVDVGSVTTDFQAGTALVSNLRVANPVGYASPDAVVIDSFTATIDYENQEVESIVIDGPKVFAELKGTRTNFQDLIDAMPEDEEEEADEEETVITIRRLAINRPAVSLSAPKFNIVDQSFTLSNFEAVNLTGTSDQISDQVSEQFLNHITFGVKGKINELAKAFAASKAKEKITEKVNEQLNEKLDEKLGEKLGGKIKNLKLGFGKKKDG